MYVGLKDFKANLTHTYTEWKLSLYTLFSNSLLNNYKYKCFFLQKNQQI